MKTSSTCLMSFPDFTLIDSVDLGRGLSPVGCRAQTAADCWTSVRFRFLFPVLWERSFRTLARCPGHRPPRKRHTQRGKSDFNHTSQCGIVACAWCLQIRNLEINHEISFPVLGLLLAYCFYPRWFALRCAPLYPLMEFRCLTPISLYS